MTPEPLSNAAPVDAAVAPYAPTYAPPAPTTPRAIDADEPPTGASRPVAPSERVQLLDVVRGFALWGVCLANLVPWFSGYENLPEKAKQALPTWPADRVTDALLNAFLHERFITIFSFLFGLGFAVQYLRAEARGARAAVVLTRRLIAMLALGLVHGFLIWYGDILAVYAITGIALLVARNWPVRRLLATGVALAVFSPIAFGAYDRLSPALDGPLVTPPRAAGDTSRTPLPQQTAAQIAVARRNAVQDSIFNKATPALTAQRSYAAVIEANRTMLRAFYFGPGSLQLFFELAGLFLLGLCVGRSGILLELDAHRDRWWLAFGWASTIALIGYLPRLGLQLAQVPPARIPQDVVGIMRTLRNVGRPAMSLAYICGLVLLFQRPAWRRRLSVLAPVGRMALTNYLTQSFLGIALFYGIGFGLHGRIGPMFQVLLSITIIAIQAVVSRWWLARYRFGPAEWLWRTLTYGKRQPMRLALGAPDDPALAS